MLKSTLDAVVRPDGETDETHRQRLSDGQAATLARDPSMQPDPAAPVAPVRPIVHPTRREPEAGK